MGGNGCYTVYLSPKYKFHWLFSGDCDVFNWMMGRRGPSYSCWPAAASGGFPTVWGGSPTLLCPLTWLPLQHWGRARETEHGLWLRTVAQSPEFWQGFCLTSWFNRLLIGPYSLPHLHTHAQPIRVMYRYVNPVHSLSIIKLSLMGLPPKGR